MIPSVDSSRKVVSVRLSEERYRQLREHARRTSAPASAFIRNLVHRALDVVEPRARERPWEASRRKRAEDERKGRGSR